MMPYNKKILILSSLAILLPIPTALLLWDRFTDAADPGLFILILPGILLAFHWLCILLTVHDPRGNHRNKAMQTIVLWIIPLLSNLVCGTMFALMLGLDFSPVVWFIIPMGILFMVIGNYLPKTKTNSYMGIKIPTTYSSEANWNATHRFAGKLWFFGGIAMILCSFLPEAAFVAVFIVILFVMILIPALYSYRFYKKELAEGKELSRESHSMSKKSKKATIAFSAAILIFVAFVMFAGEIEFHFREDSLLADSTMYPDLIVEYDSIEAVEFRQENIPGVRTGGYGSMRLLLGYFHNEEFGTYTRYTYYNPDACVVLTVRGKAVVLSCETAEETAELYQTLLEKTGK